MAMEDTVTSVKVKGANRSLLERYGWWVVRWRWLVIVSTLLLVGLATSGGQFLAFTTDYRAFFSEANPQLLAFERLQDTYTKNDNILFVLAPADGEVFMPDNLAAVEWLTEQAWQIPYSIRVDSITNFQHTYAARDELIVEDLVTDASQLSDAEIAQKRAVAMAEPLLRNRLISERGHVTGVNVIVQLPGQAPRAEVPEATQFSRDLVNRFETQFPSIKVYLSGMVIMNMSFEEASAQDLSTLFLLMFVVIVLMLGGLLRGVSSTLATLLLLLLSISSAMGLAGWAGIELTGPSSIAPTVILTLAVADSVHFLTTMLYEMRAHNRSKSEAIVESLRINFQPMFLTSITTAIGFLTMNLGEVPPFADLGNIVATGVMIAFVLSVWLLPALMAVLPVRARAQKDYEVVLIDRFADWVLRWRRNLFWGLGVAMLLLIAGIPRNELNDIFVNYFDDSFAFRQATDFLTENLTGLYDVHYSLGAGEAEGVSDPAYLAKLEAFAQWYRQQPGVIHTSVLTDTFKRLNKNLHDDDPDYYRIPTERELAAQYLLLYEMSLPYGLDLNNQINVDKSASKLSVTLQTMSTNELLALEQRAQAWLQENGLAAMQVAGASTTVMFAHIGYRNIRAMLIAAFGALILISIILIVALRSWKYGLLSLIPNIAPAAVAFGLWGLLDGQVGLALSVIVSVTLGIVVDDTIHFMSKYLRARREQGLAAEAAVRYAFHSVGIALVVTTLVLVAGFLVLSQSHFSVNADMGLMTAITITIALIVDFLFLPPLLIWLDKSTAADSALQEEQAV